LLPSCISPSPRTTTVRQALPSSWAASAAPVATGKPCPSGPLFVSTPGTFTRFGWPLSADSGAMNVFSSLRGKKPQYASVE
jgi:hypothetical protein